MKEKMMRFMQGRYGVDQLSQFLSWAALLLILVDLFVRTNVLYILGIVIMVYAYFRMFSKNYHKRQEENGWYLKHTYKLRMYFLKQKDYARLRKNYHIYTCSKCRQKIKIPKGKGMIMVTCPKCRNQFKRRS